MFFVLFVLSVSCYNNGVGRTPAMGWNSWNQFGCDVSETLILETMNGIKKYNLDKFGYKFINIDDCWQLTERDPKTRRPIPDPKRFPNGIPSLVSQVHKNGLKLGLYTDIGSETCQGRAGSFEHYEVDAQTYSEWQIDYIKVDFCHTSTEQFAEPWKFYGNFSQRINETGHHLLFSVCNWGKQDPWLWAPKIANSWRTTGDISPEYFSMIENMEKTRVLSEYAGPYNFNDPDMLEVGVVRGDKQLSVIESKSHFSLWSFMNSPLLLGNDLRNITTEILEIITNTEVIAVNQDVNGIQGKVVKEEKGCCKHVQIWKKPLSGDKIAVGLFNLADTRESESKYFNDEVIKVTWGDLELKDEEEEYAIRDLWGHKDLGNFKKEFKTPLPVKQHDIFVFTMTPV